MTQPDVHALVEPLAFLLGTWTGDGRGDYPTIEEFAFRQEVTFSHVGKPWVAYSSRTWDWTTGAPMHTETGYWRPQPDGTLEVVIAQPTGLVGVYYGRVDAGGRSAEFASDAIVRTGTAKEVSAERRLYGLREDMLMYAIDMAAVGQPLQAHVWAQLHPVVAQTPD